MQERSDAEPPGEDADMPDAAVQEAPGEPEKSGVQIFPLTISVRDDWLHRGEALQDMDLQTYVEWIEREPKPIRGAERCSRARPIFAFDAHYKLAQAFMQALRPGSVSYTHLTLPTICSV